MNWYHRNAIVRRCTLFMAVLHLSILGASPTRAAVVYNVTDLGTLGGRSSSANGINDIGQIVGYSATASGNDHAFLYSGGVMQDLGTLPGGSYSQARDINASGQIVGFGNTPTTGNQAHISAFLYSGGLMTGLGWFPGGSLSYGYAINTAGQIAGESDPPPGYPHAIRYSGGVMNDLGTLPGYPYSHAFGINDAGQVVGYAYNFFSGIYRPILYSGGVMRDLGTVPGGNGGIAWGINASGQVVGVAYMGDNWHATLYSGGTMYDLGTLAGYTKSEAFGINDAGQVVGQLAGSHQRAFLYSGGAMTDLNGMISPTSGWILERANAVNNYGWIVGTGRNPAGQWSRSFLMTPVWPLSLPSSFPSLRMIQGSHTTPGNSSITINTPGISMGGLTLATTGTNSLTVTPTSRTVAAGATDPIPFSFGWTDTSMTGFHTGSITLTNASDPEDPNNHTMSVSGAVIANRQLTVGPIGTSGTPVRTMVNGLLTTSIASGNNSVVDDDNHSARVNTIAGGIASDGYASVRYQGTLLATFNGANQIANLAVTVTASLQRGNHQGSINLAPTLLSNGEVASVGAAVQPAMLNYNLNVLANRALTVGTIGTFSQPTRAMIDAPLATAIASGSYPVLDDDNHTTRVNTVASGVASNGNATVAYLGTPRAVFNGSNQIADLTVSFSQTGLAYGSLDLAPAMLSNGEAASVGAAVQPATLDYNVAALANRQLNIGAIGASEHLRVMVDKTPAATTSTIASGSDPMLDDDNHATRINTVASGTASDGYATVAYRSPPPATFSGPSQSANLAVTFAASSQAGIHSGVLDLAPDLLSDGEAASVGAQLQPANLDYAAAVLANRQLTVASVGTTSTPARAVVHSPITTTIASGGDPLLDSDDAATRVNTVASGTAKDRNGATVTYQGTPLAQFNGPSQSTDLALNFSKLGHYQGVVDLAPKFLSDGEAPSIGAAVQSAALTYNVNVLTPRRLLTLANYLNFGGVLRGASVSGNVVVKSVNSHPEAERTTMVYVAPDGTKLGPLTVGQTLISGGGRVNIPVSGTLDTYMDGSVRGSIPVVTAEDPSVQDTTNYRKLSLVYRANVGLAHFGRTPTAFGTGESVLSATVAAGAPLADFAAGTSLSSKVRPHGTLAANLTPASWVSEPVNLRGLYGGVGSEAEIFDSTALAAKTTVSMQWRKRLRGEANYPRAPISPTLPDGCEWLASDVVKIGGVASGVTYALQMTFDNRINLAFDGPDRGKVENEFPGLYLAEFNDAANQWVNAATLGTLGADAHQGTFESLTDFLTDHSGASLADLQGSWGVDPETSTTGTGHSWAIVAGGRSGIFAVDPGVATILAGGGSSGAMAVPEPSTLVLLVMAVLGLLAYGWRGRHVFRSIAM